MSMSDPIADMLTRIRNAQRAGKPTVEMPSSKVKLAVALVLKEEGYIENFGIIDAQVQKKVMRIDLKYYAGAPVIARIDRVSRPGLRIYKGCHQLPRIMNGLGVAIISTSAGLMTDKKARENGVGGELLCIVA